MAQCPSCGDDVENLYECGECGVDHCVDCRLPDEHDCEPSETTSEAAGGMSLIGFSAKQWAVVVIWWVLAVVGNPAINSAAGMVAALVVIMAVVAAVSELWAKFRSGSDDEQNADDTTATKTSE